MIFYLLVIAFFVWWFYDLYLKRKNYPPGPLTLPLIGNLHIFYIHGFGHLSKYMCENFGDLNTLWVGSRSAIFFNSFENIQETFVKNGEIFAGRSKFRELDLIIRGSFSGIIITDGPIWREHRRFALHVMRNFGLGRNLMQERVLNEVTWMLDEMRSRGKTEGNEISVQNCIDVSVGSVINSIIFGYSFQEKSLEEFAKVKGFIQRFIKMFGNPAFGIVSGDKTGLLRRLPFFKNIYNEAKDLGVELQAFFNGQIAERKQKINFEEDSEATDYVEAYLRQQWKNEKSGKDENLYTNDQLLGCVFDMWLAGQETTSNTLAWMTLYLMEFPEIQAKLHKELDAVIGSDRIITLDDKTNLNYLNAVIAETQRYCNLVANNIPHRLTEEFEFHGYHLKENTMVIPQIGAVLTDARVFPEPDKFKPERFLDKDGSFQTKLELIPFGVGKRACLGEGLARLELYLFSANMFNHFEISVIDSNPPNMIPIIGGTKMPQPFLARIKERF